MTCSTINFSRIHASYFHEPSDISNAHCALHVIAVCVMIPFCVVNAQIDGDNIFSVDQIISIDLAFPQDDFWGDLQTHYAADENEYIPAMLTLTDVSGTHVMDSVGVRLKGNSSYSHPGVKSRSRLTSTSTSRARTTTASRSSTSATDSRTPPACARNYFSMRADRGWRACTSRQFCKRQLQW